MSVCVCLSNTIRTVCDMMRTNGLTDRGTHSGRVSVWMEIAWGTPETCPGLINYSSVGTGCRPKLRYFCTGAATETIIDVVSLFERSQFT